VSHEVTSTALTPIAPDAKAQPSLIVTHSSHSSVIGKVVLLDLDEVTIGRAPESTLFIDEHGLSRVHARVVRAGSRFELIDAGSTNGTFVNGERITHQLLRDGDIVQVGAATVLRFSSREHADRADAALRQALVAAHVGVWDLTVLTGRISWSEQADRALSAPVGALSERHGRLVDQVWVDDRPRLEAAIAAAISGDRLEIELRLDVPTRGYVWVAFQGDVIRDGTGHPHRITGTVMGIAARKQHEAELRRQSLLFESLYDGVVLVDLEGKILDWNASADRLMPRTKPEMRGDLAFSLFPGDADELFETCLRAVADAGRWTTEVTLSHATPITCEVVVVQLRDASELAIGYVMVLRDVTERTKLQAQLIFADRLASLGTLAAGVGHEINNPLSFVMANLSFLEEELIAGTTEKAELINVLRDSLSGVKRIATIVKDLRTFSRSDQDLSPVRIDVAKTVNLACSMAANEIRHRATLVRTIDDVPTVSGQESRLGQVVLNLMINAAQSIPVGNVTANEVRVRVFAPDTTAVCIEISDTGSGMSPEVQSRIFDPFFTTKSLGGSGLGLAICHGLVSSMGGIIGVKSAPGEGSIFTVTLPSDQRDHLETLPSIAAVAVAPARHGRVLVVDDEAPLAAAIVRVLSSTQEVRSVTNAKAALALFEAGERFDVVLSDLMMPDMTGMDFYEQLSRTVPEQAQKMIFMTGGAFTEQAASFVERFPKRVVSKPLDMVELRRLINQQLVDARPT